MHSTLNVCFMCLCQNDNNCSSVNEQIITRITYILPEISIFKLGVPLHICCNCAASLELFSKFKEACLENSLSLEASIKESQKNLEPSPEEPSSSIQSIEQVFIKGLVEEDIETTPEPEPTKNKSLKQEKRNVSTPQIDNADDISDGGTAPELSTIAEQEPMEQDEEQAITFSSEKKTSKPTRPIVKQQGYLCGICQQSFIAVDDMDIKHHMLRDHSSSGRYKCKLCDQVFDREIFLYVHMQNKIHTTKPNLRCFVCGKLFTKINHLKTHLKLYIGLKEFQCFVCQIKFSQKGLFDKHMDYHRQAKLRCSICGIWFDDMKTFTEHEKTHKKSKRFSCYRCGKLFTQKQNMLKHIRTVHKKIKNYHCSHCDKSFTCKESLTAHTKWHENVANKIPV